MDNYLVAVVIGIIFGFISRLSLLRTDFRQYPTYSQGGGDQYTWSFPLFGGTRSCSNREKRFRAN